MLPAAKNELSKEIYNKQPDYKYIKLVLNTMPTTDMTSHLLQVQDKTTSTTHCNSVLWTDILKT